MWLLHRYDPLSWEYPTWASINGPAVNILKGAVAVADRVLTVSQVIYPSTTIDHVSLVCAVNTTLVSH